MKKKYLKSSCLFVLVLMLLSVIFPAGAFAQSETKTIAATADESVMGVAYRGHVQNLGNVPTPEGTMIAGPDALGTKGEGLRLEGFWIDLTGDVPANAGISYQVHVQNIGWQDAVNSGDFAGTDRRGLRIEAIKISLVNLPDYDVYYRGHVQNVGNIPQIDGNWGWVKNGEELGTTGRGLRLEELQIKIVRKGIDLTAYNMLLNTIEKLDAANYSPESWATLQTALTQNKMTEANSQTSIDAATQAIQAAYDALSLKVVAVYDKPGVYGPETGTQTIEGSVIIDVSGVTLQNLVIKGDLTVSEAVGDGDATLNYLTVEGTTILAGGGTGGATLAGQATSGDMTLAGNSGGITIRGDILTKVMVTKNDRGGIRITVINSEYDDFEVINIPEGQPIILGGWFKSVMIQVPDLKLEIDSGTIVESLFAGTADAKKSASGLEISGQGTINNFEVGKFSDDVSVGANIRVTKAQIYGDNSEFMGVVGSANIVGDHASFRIPPVNSTGNPPVIVNPPAPPPGGGGSTITPLAKVSNVVLSATGVATWDNVDNESSFNVQLYKGGVAQGAIVNVAANTLTANFLSAMRSAGTGAYTVKVTAKGNGVAYSDGAVSDASSAQNVIQLTAVSAGLTWTGDVAHWTTVADAVSYDVQLYKDNVVLGTAVNVLAANAASGTDFTSAISTGGTGTYTYKVTANGNANLILDAAESIASGTNVKAAVSTVHVTITANKAAEASGLGAVTTVTYSLVDAASAVTGATYTGSVNVPVGSTIYFFAKTVDGGEGSSGKSFVYAGNYAAIIGDLGGKSISISAGSYSDFTTTSTITSATGKYTVTSDSTSLAANINTISANGTEITTSTTVGTFLGNLIKENASQAWIVTTTANVPNSAATFTGATAKATGDMLETGDVLTVKSSDGTKIRSYGITVTAVATPASALVNGVSFFDDDTNDDQTVIALGEPSVNGNTFVYKISDDANAVATPNVGDDLNAWTDVENGQSIQAANDTHIGVAEIDANRKAVQFSDETAVTEAEAGSGLATGLTVSLGNLNTEINSVEITVSPVPPSDRQFLYRVVSYNSSTGENAGLDFPLRVGDVIMPNFMGGGYQNGWKVMNSTPQPVENFYVEHCIEVVEVKREDFSVTRWGWAGPRT